MVGIAVFLKIILKLSLGWLIGDVLEHWNEDM